LKDKSAVTKLSEILRSNKIDNVRWSVATALGEIGDQLAVESLIHELADESKGVQTRTAEALGKIKDKCAVEPLMRLLRDDDCSLRQMVGLSLGLQDENNHVHYYIFQALGNLGDSSILNTLKQAYHRKPDEAVKNMASQTISYVVCLIIHHHLPL
jgi:HEAT repeat protein